MSTLDENKDYVNDCVVKSFLNKTKTNEKLFAEIALFRHLRELDIIESELKENEPIPTAEKSKFGRAIIDNTVNALRRRETQRISEKKKICLQSIDELRSKSEAVGISLSDGSEQSLKDCVAETFADDATGKQKLFFAMTVCLSDGSDGGRFIYGDETLFNVSTVLFGDELRMKQIKNRLYENYKWIVNGNFWERNKDFIIGMGITLALVTTLTPVMLGVGAASSAIVTNCLAQIGHCAPGLIGVGLAKITGMALAGTALLGGTVLAGMGVANIIRNESAKKAFRNLSPDDVAALLAMKATLIDFGTPSLGDDERKIELDECLSGLNDFRSDAEYMLIVEKCDAENSRKKIQYCNRFVSRLAAISGI